MRQRGIAGGGRRHPACRRRGSSRSRPRAIWGHRRLGEQRRPRHHEAGARAHGRGTRRDHGRQREVGAVRPASDRAALPRATARADRQRVVDAEPRPFRDLPLGVQRGEARTELADRECARRPARDMSRRARDARDPGSRQHGVRRTRAARQPAAAAAAVADGGRGRPVIVSAIDTPVAEVYTNPAHPALALKYFQDVGAFERESFR